MTSDGSRPSLPVTVTSIFLIAGLALTAIVLYASPPPPSSPAPGSGGLVTPSTAPVGLVRTAGPSATGPSETVAGATGIPAPTPNPSGSGPAPTPSGGGTAPTPTPTPRTTPAPTPAPTPEPDAAPTRIRIAALRIDLPVVRPRARERVPLCDVAEYLTSFGTPGGGATTYLYANAMAGMFLPIMRAVRDDPASLVGLPITVWTADDVAWTYEVRLVRRHQTDIDWAFRLPPASLVVQTADTGTGMVMLVARLRREAAAQPAAAHPPASPRACP